MRLLEPGDYQARAQTLRERLLTGLASLRRLGVLDVRGRGLWAGIDLDPALATGRKLAERLLGAGVLVKDTHGSTVRISPPLVVKEHEIDYLIEQFAVALSGL